MHQVLVAMLTVTPAPDAPAAAKGAEIKAHRSAAAPAKAGRPQVVLGKKGKGGAQLALVTVPRPAAVN
ncbi:MAG: hypothetical protein ACM3Q1_14960 [Bacteroidales bacterium]